MRMAEARIGWINARYIYGRQLPLGCGRQGNCPWGVGAKNYTVWPSNKSSVSVLFG